MRSNKFAEPLLRIYLGSPFGLSGRSVVQQLHRLFVRTHLRSLSPLSSIARGNPTCHALILDSAMQCKVYFTNGGTQQFTKLAYFRKLPALGPKANMPFWTSDKSYVVLRQLIEMLSDALGHPLYTLHCTVLHLPSVIGYSI
ncbi:hypothetical protein AVEN_176056-1 [Araneus ventricosus]|uniref:Uncharacterized protein n=1 Tax=Araneus ventricosus TaxID=182803 RepID=A0A4Y2F7E5_ARAVE|nr:hypothetical protein AVEN_176056-1 [Araneus ventricosus]